ncbi:hypothetical protein [Rheinheimera gaetbuli]
MKNLITFFAALSCCLPLAAAPIPLEQALELCRAEKNALRRLTCYDAIADGTATAAPTQATSATVQPLANKTQASEQFGIEHRQQEQTTVEQLNVVVKSLKYNPYKELTVEFTNGQVWQQIGTDYYKIAEGETHTIRRSAFNSFLLGNDKNSRTIRVKREK